jgi:hypothetical protein
MAKKKTQKKSAKATLAEVIKEMAKERVAMSARSGLWRWLSWRWSSEFSQLVWSSSWSTRAHSLHRDDQLFLDDASSHMHEEQTELLAKVNRLTIPVRVFSIGSGVFLLALVAMLKLNALQ